jgi:hypothetical protein
MHILKNLIVTYALFEILGSITNKQSIVNADHIGDEIVEKADNDGRYLRSNNQRDLVQDGTDTSSDPSFFYPDLFYPDLPTGIGMGMTSDPENEIRRVIVKYKGQPSAETMASIRSPEQIIMSIQSSIEVVMLSKKEIERMNEDDNVEYLEDGKCYKF